MGKLLKTSELKGMTYVSFNRNGMSVDVRGFLKSDGGRRMLASMSPPSRSRSVAQGKAKPKA